MILHLLKTLVRSVAVFLLVTYGAFALMYGDAQGIARGILGLTATQDQINMKVAELGLDRPLIVQYGDWLSGVLTGNPGQSYFTGESVSSALSNRIPVTLSLVIPTVILTVALAVLLGVAAAHYGGWVDKLIQTVTG